MLLVLELGTKLQSLVQSQAQNCFFFFGMRSENSMALIFAAIMKSFSVKPPAQHVMIKALGTAALDFPTADRPTEHCCWSDDC